MKSKSQIAAFFDLQPGRPGHDEIINRLRNVQITGALHGKQGWYPNGDFSSDADWCYGIGAEIQALETLLECYSGEVFELYSNAHGALFRDGTINPGERDWKPDVYDMWFDGGHYLHEVKRVSVHARSFEEAANLAAEYAAERWPGLFESEDDMVQRYEKAKAELGIDPDEGTGLCEETICSKAEEGLTCLSDNLWIESDGWGGDGPR